MSHKIVNNTYADYKEEVTSMLISVYWIMKPILNLILDFTKLPLTSRLLYTIVFFGFMLALLHIKLPSFLYSDQKQTILILCLFVTNENFFKLLKYQTS